MVIGLQYSGWIFILAKRVQHIRLQISEKFGNTSKIIAGHPITFSAVDNATLLRIMTNLPEVLLTIQRYRFQICKIYGGQMALIYADQLICSTGRLHFFIVMINSLTIKNFDTKKVLKLITYILLLTLSGIQLSTSMWTGSFARSEWNKMAFRLQEISFKCKNHEIQRAVEKNLEILHQNRLEFHAGDFFKLELQIATGILSSIATYLVILLQFQIYPDEGDNSDLTDDLLVFGSNAY
ncbi:uncharacterized protein LOC119650006 [Hermetia illucens]|uniref:uncharacterized protein LOC119650006 n=1 Tax=Hermetia illucens TaxID=343691 RepID=UPI0018CC1FCD|nr:uncharacterized protein LOC119650006 [Hermetia illucens]